ncbi:MAG: hypothetical protein ACC655_11310, partial [Rhodothermia bacterium]
MAGQECDIDHQVSPHVFCNLHEEKNPEYTNDSDEFPPIPGAIKLLSMAFTCMYLQTLPHSGTTPIWTSNT